MFDEYQYVLIDKSRENECESCGTVKDNMPGGGGEMMDLWGNDGPVEK